MAAPAMSDRKDAVLALVQLAGADVALGRRTLASDVYRGNCRVVFIDNGNVRIVGRRRDGHGLGPGAGGRSRAPPTAVPRNRLLRASSSGTMLGTAVTGARLAGSRSDGS